MSCANPGAARLALTLAAALAFTAPAQALDYQLHGFLTQGFIQSNGNNFYGDSTDGSFEYFEAAVNGAVRPWPELLVSAQVLARDAGASDDGKPRLDYGFVDYGPWSDPDANFGVRLGRVKNPYGFYNDTRDVVFTRPGVLLPASVYFEAAGARTLLFSSDGAQAYAGTDLGEHYLSLVATYAPDRTLSGAEEGRFVGDLAQQGDVNLDGFIFTRLHDEWANGRWGAAVSYVRGNLEFDPNPGAPLDFDFSFDLYLLSIRYNAERFGLTAEYGITDSAGTFTTSGTPSEFDATSDGIYLQADYFLNPAWTVMARYDGSFTDRNDRGGDRCVGPAGAATDRHECFAHDFSTGVNWKPDAHWGAWAEYHWIDGASTVSDRDNEGAHARHWSMLLLMGGYRF